MDDGDRDFLEATLPHLDAIYRVARHAARDHARAEDLVQETYLRAFSAFAGHRGPSTRAWLVTICLNLVRSEARRRARRPIEEPMGLPFEPELASSAEGGRAVADEAIANLDRESVARALALLPDEQRVAIVLMDLLGYSASEVGDLLDCPRGTVLSRVHRGHRRLAEHLSTKADHELS